MQEEWKEKDNLRIIKVSNHHQIIGINNHLNRIINLLKITGINLIGTNNLISRIISLCNLIGTNNLLNGDNLISSNNNNIHSSILVNLVMVDLDSLQ